MAALFVEPEDHRLPGGLAAVDRQLDPVLDRNVLGLAGTEDVAFFDLLLEQGGAGGIDDADGAVAGSLESLVVGAVFLGLLRHQADIGDAAHGGRIELAVTFAVLDDLAVHGGVAAIGNHGDGVLKLVLQIPHLAAVADDVRHRGVDDDIVGDVQVGDSFAGIDHGQSGLLFVAGVDVGFDFGLLARRETIELGQDITHAKVRVGADLLQGAGMLLKGVLEVNRDAVAEHDRVGDLHHGRLEVQGKQNIFLLGLFRGLRIEFAQGGDVHGGAVENLAFLQGQPLFQNGDVAARIDKLEIDGIGLVHGDRLFTFVEIATFHMRNAAIGDLRPGLHHSVRIFLSEFLDRDSSAPVRVSFTQHRVDGGAEYFGIAFLDLFFCFGLRLFRILGNIIAFFTQFLDRGLQLRDRCTDIRQFDDVGVGSLGQFTQLGQVIGDFLVFREVVGKVGDDSAGKGDVSGFDFDASALGKGLNNGKQGISCQCRCFINLCPNNF